MSRNFNHCRAGLLSRWATGLALVISAGSALTDDDTVVSSTPITGTETIIIRADRAWEAEDATEVLHFAGNFELISPDWELTAEEADLFGPLDDPERIVARGAPAVVTILKEDETVIGQGGTIVYERDTDVLTLTDDAEVTGENISMKSAEIVYDVGEDRLKSSGTTGVEMILQRETR